jgi:uncharacterized protein YbjT (DUF2867 family)
MSRKGIGVKYAKTLLVPGDTGLITMEIKAVIFGSTGMVGQGVLRECLESAQVVSVLVVNRQSGGVVHEKLQEVVHADFSDFSSLISLFARYNTCFFCLGVSAAGLAEKEYHKITYELTLKAAGTLLKTHQDFTFCYVSGAGTDNSERGRMMWARVKGKTENAVLSMPFKQAYVFRPGYIQPLHGIQSRIKTLNFFYKVFKPIYFMLKPFNSMVTDTSSVGKAMIRIASQGYHRKTIDMADINALARGK